MAGVIYYGIPDTREAMERCSIHLNVKVSDLDTDLHFLRYTEKMSIDDIRQMLEIISLKADGYCVVFERADLLSAQCQNSILKALEDRDDVLFVFYAGNVKMLGTVESRSIIVNSCGLTLEAFRNTYTEVDDAFYYLSEGSESLLDSILEDENLCGIVMDAASDVIGFLKNKKDLLLAFGQMKEKGTDNFFDKKRELVSGLYSMFTHLLIEKIDEPETVDMLDVLEKHKELLRKSNSYGKNDFLDLLISL